MCTLLVFRRPLPGVELAVAAARDELYARAAGEWSKLRGAPEVWGGRDPEAGGSWLALSGAGFLVAVTNARLGARRRKGQRSRGLLVLDLAAAPSPGAAADRLEREALVRYAPVNVVVAWPDGLAVATNLPEPRVERSVADRVALGNTPAFAGDPRVEALLELAAPRPDEPPAAWMARAGTVLSRHDTPSACHHLEHGGTVAATVAVLGEDGGWSVLHADGPPCTAPFVARPWGAGSEDGGGVAADVKHA